MIHIQRELNLLKQAERDFLSKQKKDRENFISRLKDKINDLRKQCPHDFEYYPDPSGNNDCYYQCKYCDLEKSR